MAYTIRSLDSTDMRLIELVRANPMLYDPRLPDFRNKHRKEAKWQEIADELDMRVKQLLRRWTCLRDKYTRELRQLRLNSDCDDFYLLKHDILEQMDFVRIFVRKRSKRRTKTKKNDAAAAVASIAEQPTDEDELADSDMSNSNPLCGSPPNYQQAQEDYEQFVEVEAIESYEEYTPASSVQQQTKKISLPNSLQAQNQTINHRHDASPTLQQLQVETQADASPVSEPTQIVLEEVQDDADGFFCKSLAVYLRQLSRRHKIKAKVEIYQILQKYVDLEEDELARNNANG